MDKKLIKNLGQNFLINDSFIDKFVNLIRDKIAKDNNVIPPDMSGGIHIIEIGAGQGALTSKVAPLIHADELFDIYEIDSRFIRDLSKFENNNIKIRNEDFLQAQLDSNPADSLSFPRRRESIPNPPGFPITCLPVGTELGMTTSIDSSVAPLPACRQARLQNDVDSRHHSESPVIPAKAGIQTGSPIESGMTNGVTQTLVFGAIPYNITSPILHKLLGLKNRPEFMAFIIQKEVALKITAKKHKNYWSHIVAGYKCQIHFDIPPDAFMPSPKVTSCAITFEKDDGAWSPNGDEFRTWKGFLHLLFQHPRKMLNKVFSKEELASLKINPNLRPGELDPQEVVAIYRYYCSSKVLLFEQSENLNT